MIVAVFVLAAGLGWIVMLAKSFGKNGFTVIGAVAILVFFVGALMLLFALSGLGDRLSNGARGCTENDHGTGVSLRTSRITLPLLFLFGGGAMYGIAAWLDRHAGVGSDLLPASKNNSSGATFALIAAIVAAVLFILFSVGYLAATVELYPDGVRRVIRFPVLRRVKEQFVAWDEIATIVPTKVKGSAQTGGYPVIALELTAPREPVQHKLWDTPDRVSLPTYLMVCEPNTLLAILRFLLTDPDQRTLLARPDASSWFTPPPRSTRIRLSEQVSGQN
ncbi:hypothetical protein ACFXHA_04710 [Nocardia sp. NPDC059240]|uniref:hypothetical protein n=1 Tax=Nocardia sp. NPDC059240 TaxID=3346786 RepID=UPI0036BFB2B0